MTAKIAINGFGRIGRNVLRALAEHGARTFRWWRSTTWPDTPPSRTCSATTACTAASRARPSSRATRCHPRRVRQDAGADQGAGRGEPAMLPWRDLGVDIAMECTGVFTSKDKGERPPGRGRQRVLVIGPGRGRRTDGRGGRQPGPAPARAHGGVQRVLHHQLPGPPGQGAARGDRHRAGHMTTIHSYTNDQNLARRVPQGLLPAPRRGDVADPDLDRGREGGGPGPAGAPRAASTASPSGCRPRTSRSST